MSAVDPRAKPLPKHLDLLRIRFPVTAVLSVGHRASGIVLFLVTPLLVYALGRSLSGPAGFEAVAAGLASPAARVGLFVVLWSLVHHSLAGLRYLVLDLGIGESRARARQSAWLVFGLEAVAVAALLVAML